MIRALERRLAAPFWLFPLVFLFVGPPTGGLVVGLLIVSHDFGGLVGPTGLPEQIANVLAVVILGCVFGLVPAAITGLAAGVIARWTRSFPLWLGSTVAFGIAVSYLILGQLGAVAGGIAAVVSTAAVLAISQER